jgi:hypothetical protein
LIAASTDGSSLIWMIPSTASVENQTSVTGPKADATRRPAALNREQQDQDEQCERPHLMLEPRRGELKTFDGR